MGENRLIARASRVERKAKLHPAGQLSVPVLLSHVGFSYGAQEVLSDVDLTVGDGEACVILGENGAGKSTLLKVMLGSLAASRGNVELFGVPVGSFRDWQRVGYVPQQVAGAYERFPATVAEVVAANRYAVQRRFSPKSANDGEAVERALEKVGAQGLSRRLVGELSGGQLQRVLLARALVNDPDLLILDEPTSGMDTDAVGSFVDLLQEIVASGERSALLITHDMRRLAALPARMLRLESGRLREVARSAQPETRDVPDHAALLREMM